MNDLLNVGFFLNDLLNVVYIVHPLMQRYASFIYVLFISCSVLISGFENLKYGNNNV